MPFPRKYNLPNPWNVYYSRARSQARYRREEWAFTEDTWMRHWQNSGVMEHRHRRAHGYCMVRLDRTEAWGPHNCVIVPRRKQLGKVLWRGIKGEAGYPRDPSDWREEDDVTPKHKRNRSFE